MAASPLMTDEIAEIEREIDVLRKRLTDARRRVPREPVADFVFESVDGPVRLSELFGDNEELLVIHNMGRSCPYCTLWADGLNGVVDHLGSRAAFAVATPDDPATQQAFAAERGWGFRMVSCGNNDFARDLGFEPEPERYWPGVSAFHRSEDGVITRTGCATFGPGDPFCSVWHLFDLLVDGAQGWTPRFQYGESARRG
ncbi:MAG: DUF899 family protein [Phycisphaerales bacterium]|nr:DUF899 family protein [Phycisphaerae bacterium]NNF43862.1 DUF899 family protein [Phycisphaerales bacterium]NNM26326.1 DUF899 family protein [Phycisphaerales bacterium]